MKISLNGVPSDARVKRTAPGATVAFAGGQGRALAALNGLRQCSKRN
jgi:hypothetical protein